MTILELKIRPKCREKKTDSDFLKKVEFVDLMLSVHCLPRPYFKNISLKWYVFSERVIHIVLIHQIIKKI